MPAPLSHPRRRPLGFAVALLVALTTFVGLDVTTARPAEAATSTAASRMAPASALAAKALQIAPAYRGRPYRWGATGPWSFDCSGYTRYVFARAGKWLPRTAAAQYAATRHLSRGAARPGDLIFLKNRYGHVYHVGIYAGYGRYWEASHPGDVVKLAPIYGTWSVGRVI